MRKIYPLRFKPVYKDYLWGGNRIPKLYNRNQPDGIYAESWEISTHPDGKTVIENGPLAGKTLCDLLPENKEQLLGSNVTGSDFPLIIKLIDARKKLSVQVHPNDDNAAAVGGEPKTEMWYFLDGDESAKVYCGLNPGVGEKEFIQALDDKTVADLLRPIPAVPGEAVYLSGGRIHSTGAGCLIFEVQQKSNTTYRLYDWDRKGPDGKPRELHIDQALRVIDWDNHEDPRCKIHGTTIQSCDYFQLDRFVMDSETRFPMSGKSFHTLFVAAGGGSILWDGGEEKLTLGQSWLLPAALGDYTLRPDPALTVLRTIVP